VGKIAKKILSNIIKNTVPTDCFFGDFAYWEWIVFGTIIGTK